MTNTLKIAVLGSGNVGSTLAKKWMLAGQEVRIGARMPLSEKNQKLASEIGKELFLPIEEAVAFAEVLLIATPAQAAVAVAKSLGDTEGKVIIDSMNIVMGRGPEGYATTAQVILDHTTSRDLVKCFNTTGYNNMADPVYGHIALDLFMAGDSVKAKEVTTRLARLAGFAECYDIGGNDKFDMMEEFARFWINLALFQGQGRNIGFKLLKR